MATPQKEIRAKRGLASSFFDERSGGFYIAQEGHNYVAEELEAAKILAHHGYRVVLAPEDGREGSGCFRLIENKSPYAEGRIGSVWYEQYTPGVNGGGKNSIKNALWHAYEKGVPIALLYDKHGKTEGLNLEREIARHKGQKKDYEDSVTRLILIKKHPTRNLWSVLDRTV